MGLSCLNRDGTIPVIYRCIVIHNVSIHVSIQQNEYEYIDILMYHCVYWSTNCFLQWIKLWNRHFTEYGCEKNLVRHSDDHGFYSYLRKLSYYFQLVHARASNTFKQWYIAVSWYFWHDALIYLEPVSSHLYC